MVALIAKAIVYRGRLSAYQRQRGDLQQSLEARRASVRLTANDAGLPGEGMGPA